MASGSRYNALQYIPQHTAHDIGYMQGRIYREANEAKSAGPLTCTETLGRALNKYSLSFVILYSFFLKRALKIV